jgi:TldD protein
MSLDLGRKGLEEAVKAGATYADIRIGEILDEHLTVKNGVPEETNLLQTKGFGIRVMIKGAWGFAASVDLTKKEVKEVAHKAVAIARASAKVKKKAVALKKSSAKKDKYSTPMKKNPFKIPLEEKMEPLMGAERIVAKQSPS